MNTIIQAALIEGIINELLDGNVDTAIVRLVRMRRELQDTEPKPDAPRDSTWNAAVRNELRREAKASIALDGETQSIPPMVPVAGKRVKPKDLKCTTCGAKPGAECFEMTSRGPGAKPTSKRREPGSTTHVSRRQAARAANGG